MPTDLSCNIAEFNFVLSSIQALQNLYLPDLFMAGIGILIFPDCNLCIHVHCPLSVKMMV